MVTTAVDMRHPPVLPMIRHPGGEASLSSCRHLQRPRGQASLSSWQSFGFPALMTPHSKLAEWPLTRIRGKPTLIRSTLLTRAEWLEPNKTQRQTGPGERHPSLSSRSLSPNPNYLEAEQTIQIASTAGSAHGQSSIDRQRSAQSNML